MPVPKGTAPFSSKSFRFFKEGDNSKRCSAPAAGKCLRMTSVGKHCVKHFQTSLPAFAGKPSFFSRCATGLPMEANALRVTSYQRGFLLHKLELSCLLLNNCSLCNGSGKNWATLMAAQQEADLNPGQKWQGRFFLYFLP